MTRTPLTLSLALTSVLALAACGKSSDDPTDTGMTDSGDTETDSGDTETDSGDTEDTDTEDTDTEEEVDEDRQRAQEAYDAVADGLAQADLSDPEIVQGYAGFSAPSQFIITYAPKLTASLLYQFGGGSVDCPVITGLDENGEQTEAMTLTGGCTDDNGTEWFGSYVEEGYPMYTAVFDGWGSKETSDDCPGEYTTTLTNGVVEFGISSTGSAEADALIVMSTNGPNAENNCIASSSDIGINSVIGLGESTEGTLFNSSGEVAVSSEGQGGTVEVTTADEVVNGEVCEPEALSGTTTLTTDDHEAVITYDGATDCDEAATVTWTLDGVDQGVMEGISCASQHQTPRDFGLVAALLGLVGLSRRKR